MSVYELVPVGVLLSVAEQVLVDVLLYFGIRVRLIVLIRIRGSAWIRLSVLRRASIFVYLYLIIR